MIEQIGTANIISIIILLVGIGTTYGFLKSKISQNEKDMISLSQICTHCKQRM